VFHQDVVANLRFEEWPAYKRTLHVLERDDPEFWQELSDAYDQLSRTMKRGAVPPSADASAGIRLQRRIE
jgi:hypothetical protein